jgi:uncharacterized spore protein YtfJ
MAENGSDRAAVFDDLAAVRDALSVRQVFGEPFAVDGTTVIPVAAVRGGGGGGSGEGNAPEGQGSGTGSGMGFGVSSRALGVYVVKDGTVRWEPALDVSRLAMGGLLVAALAVVSMRRVLVKRR